jgi:hypothetical protein
VVQVVQVAHQVVVLLKEIKEVNLKAEIIKALIVIMTHMLMVVKVE